MSDFGDRLAAFIESHGLSHNKLGKILGIDQQRITSYVNGIDPSFKFLNAFYKQYPNDFLWMTTGQSSIQNQEGAKPCEECAKWRAKYEQCLERHVGLLENLYSQSEKTVSHQIRSATPETNQDAAQRAVEAARKKAVRGHGSSSMQKAGSTDGLG